MLTQKSAIAAVRKLGLCATVADGEMRVTFKRADAQRLTGQRDPSAWQERQAYYTDVYEDAVGTAQRMALALR